MVLKMHPHFSFSKLLLSFFFSVLSSPFLLIKILPILRIVNTISKKNKVGGWNLSNFKTYYITTVTKTVWHR